MPLLAFRNETIWDVREETVLKLNRRDFIRLGAMGIGALVLGGCGRGERGAATAPPAAQPSVSVTPPPVAAPVSGGAPDMILVNGKIVTMDAADTTVQALAIQGGKVQQTGTDQVIRALANAQTKVVDLRGRVATPGLVDNHNHLYAMGLTGTAYVDINPPAVKTPAEMLAKLSEAISKTPKGEWVIGQGFITFEGRYPEKQDLDPISPNHPVMLINQGGHIGTANSMALKLAGITSATQNPKFGVIGRDAKGEPNGVLYNHAAMDMVRKLWGTTVLTPDARALAATVPQPKFAAVGVTTFGDVNVRGLDQMQAYFDTGRNKKMLIRSSLMNTIEYYPELKGRPEAVQAMLYEDEYMRFGGYKFLVDGSVQMVYTHEPHNGMAWNVATWDARALNDAVKTLHSAGFQCAFHVMGDAAVDMALDAIEGAMKASPRSDPRHRIEHAVLNTDKAIKRTKELGVVVSTQPHGIRAFGDFLINMLGEDRAKRMMPTRAWLDAGIKVALSSDTPTLPWYAPQITLAAAISRLTATNKPLGLDQVMTFKEALRAHTITAAYGMFEEKTRGSLEPGKLGDVAVWTEDPYTLPWEQLYKTTIDLTILGGKIIYEKPAA